MKATELRIGNWVLIPTNNQIMIPSFPEKVKGIGIFGGIDFTEPEYPDNLIIPAIHCAGIPLTEEWLLKFGFWRNNNLCKRWFLAEAYLLERGWTQHRFYIYLEKKRISARHGCMGDSNHLKYLKYVHEFQNLFFALTGEELEIRNT